MTKTSSSQKCGRQIKSVKYIFFSVCNTNVVPSISKRLMQPHILSLTLNRESEKQVARIMNTVISKLVGKVIRNWQHLNNSISTGWASVQGNVWSTCWGMEALLSRWSSICPPEGVLVQIFIEMQMFTSEFYSASGWLPWQPAAWGEQRGCRWTPCSHMQDLIRLGGGFRGYRLVACCAVV